MNRAWRGSFSRGDFLSSLHSITLLCKTGCVIKWEGKKETGLATNGVNAGRQPGVQKTQQENEQKDVRWPHTPSLTCLPRMVTSHSDSVYCSPNTSPATRRNPPWEHSSGCSRGHGGGGGGGHRVAERCTGQENSEYIFKRKKERESHITWLLFSEICCSGHFDSLLVHPPFLFPSLARSNTLSHPTHAHNHSLFLSLSVSLSLLLSLCLSLSSHLHCYQRTNKREGTVKAAGSLQLSAPLFLLPFFLFFLCFHSFVLLFFF